MPNQLDVPVRPSDASAMADALLAGGESRNGSDEWREAAVRRLAALEVQSLQVCPRSVAVQGLACYAAADTLAGGRRTPVLLRFAPASADEAEMFGGARLVGRVRPGGGRETVVHAIPFASTDHGNILRFVTAAAPEFFPRPQGAAAAIAAGNRHPEVSLPAAFDAFGRILSQTGWNAASTVQLSATREMTLESVIAERDGENPTAAGHTRVSIEHLYHAGLWAAVRAGWRHGYTAEADHIIVSGDTPDEIERSFDRAVAAIQAAAGFTKFTTDTSRIFDMRADHRSATGWSEGDLEQLYGTTLDADLRGWVEAEFSRPFAVGDRTYNFSRHEIRRLAVKFGPSLVLNERLYDSIVRARAAAGFTSGFDFEPSLDEAETLTTPKELIFYMHWLRTRGRPAQLVPPNLGFKKRQAYPEDMKQLVEYTRPRLWPEIAPRVAVAFDTKPLDELHARVAELADVARHFDGTLSIHSGSGKQAAVLQQIGRATAGRVNFKISGELQLQLLDVLSEQPAGSPWRALFERMAGRCNEFAARGAFGSESELAARYSDFFLGDARRGRIDGNLFLVFWIGNMVGSRDVHSPDGDRRFFKDKLDEVPEELLHEVRRRNSDYIVWLAENLRQ